LNAVIAKHAENSHKVLLSVPGDPCVGNLRAPAGFNAVIAEHAENSQKVLLSVRGDLCVAL
jgi:hypothetical protein